jgi:hypothetical protein
MRPFRRPASANGGDVQYAITIKWQQARQSALNCYEFLLHRETLETEPYSRAYDPPSDLDLAA